MKKYAYILSLALVIMLSVCACKDKEEETPKDPTAEVEEEVILYPELSIQELQVYALENDGEAAYYLGRIYDYGLMDESQNFQEALKWYQVSADNGFGQGYMGLGYMYLSGCGVEKNYDTAKECFQNAIKANCMEGYVGIARCILEQEDTENYHTVYVNIRKACDEKLLDGYYYMGYLYEKGIEVTEDVTKAAKYYELVSESDSTEVNDQYAINSANTRLGYLYAKGLLGEVDGETAISYFDKAATNEFAQAQYYLGIMYEMGQGVDRDYEKALAYFEQAAANDYAPALSQIGYIYFNGRGVDTDYEQAVYYEKLAAAQGYVPAQINLGYMYENGIGVELNLETALAYYKMAEESDYEGAEEAVTRIENLLVNQFLSIGMKKVAVSICTVLFAFCLIACGQHQISETKEEKGEIPTEDRQIEELTDAVDVILESATAEFIGNYPVTEGFFYWVANTYGSDVIFDIVNKGDVSDKEIWFDATGNSIYVLWQGYCDATGLDAYDYSRINYITTNEEDVISFDFSGDVNLCEEAATTIYMDQQTNGILDCFSSDLLEEMQQTDVLVINNEFCYSTRGTPIAGKAYTFRANPERVNSLLALGTDLVTLANNHVWDYGLDALNDTMDTLSYCNLDYVGAGKNLTEACRPQYYIANGRKIAIVDATQIERSYTYTKQATPDTPGVLKTLDSKLYCQVIREAKENADLVIACVHWGTEGNLFYGHDQEKLAKDFVFAGADAIIGGHTHCLQAVEYIENVPVFYSLGNYWFATTKNMPSDYYTGLARLEINKDLEINLKFIPCQFSKGVTSMLTGDEAKTEYEFLEKLSETTTISDDGVINRKQK